MNGLVSSTVNVHCFAAMLALAGDGDAASTALGSSYMLLLRRLPSIFLDASIKDASRSKRAVF